MGSLPWPLTGGSFCELMMAPVNINFEGVNTEIEIPAASTVNQLKERIDARLGHYSASQKLYYFGLPLKDDAETEISEFLDTGLGNSFNLIVDHASSEKRQAPPRQFSTEKEMFLIVGGRTNFEAIHLKSGKTEIKKLKAKIFQPSEKFGLAENCEGEFGQRTFQVRIYEVVEKGSIRITTEADEVFLVNSDEKITKMDPVDTKVYDECGKKDKIQTILKFFKPIAMIINGIGGMVSGAAGFAEAV